MEPFGIGARNIKECLLIQSEKLNILDNVMEEMINNHLENIASNKYDLVGKSLKISPREAQRYGDAIKKLEPKPSRGFYTGDEVNYIIPDAEIKNIDGEFFIIMNEGVLPKLTISKTYKQVLENNQDEQTSAYVKDKINQAMFLIKSIEQRKNTLYKVLECLLVNNSNQDMATLQIKNVIKKVIGEENKNKPLSDQAISEILAKDNMKISRRTVAKYREELGIKSSSMRKRV